MKINENILSSYYKRILQLLENFHLLYQTQSIYITNIK